MQITWLHLERRYKMNSYEKLCEEFNLFLQVKQRLIESCNDNEVFFGLVNLLKKEELKYLNSLKILKRAS